MKLQEIGAMELAETLETAGPSLETLLDETPLTIIRIATHIGANQGRMPSSAVTSACRSRSAALTSCDAEALIAELTSCLLTRDVDAALEWLLVVGVIDAFLPELSATKDLAQEAGRRHKDVWEHTKTVVKQSVKRPAVRWGALLHDIGKVPTRRFTQSGVQFHGHAEVGARMYDRICKRLPFERALRQKIRFLIKHHLRAAQYAPDWTDSAVRRFDRELSEHLTDLLDLSRADITSKRPGRRQALLRQISSLADRIERIRAEDAVVPALKKGIGDSIMARFGLPPSKRIGELKAELELAINRGELEAHREDDYYLAWLEGSGLAKP